MANKTLNVVDGKSLREKLKDIEITGDPDIFVVLLKASSEKERWMKSTKAMEIPGVGCIVQVTTQQADLNGQYSVAEALTFVPGVFIFTEKTVNGIILKRYLKKIDS